VSVVTELIQTSRSSIDADGYRQYRPVLFAALKKLADQGFAAPFDEGLDLIHEFFVDAWPGLMARFDPEKAQLRTYVFGAFVHFARPRIMRLARWRKASSLELESLEDLELVDTDREFDVQRLGHALARLSADDRTLLEARLGGESERTLATRLSTTRYQIRERSAEAMAKVVSLLGDSSLLEPSDFELLQALWREGRSEDDVAGALGLTASQVRVRRQKILRALLRAFPATTPRTQARQGKEDTVEPKLCDLWKELCESPNEQTVRNVQTRAEALGEHLDECPNCGERVPTSAAAAQAAYGALSGLSHEGSDAGMDDLMALRASVDEDVRRAVDGILANRVSSDLRERLKELDSINVYCAIDGLSLLLQRVTRGRKPKATLTSRELVVEQREPLPLDLVIGEVRIMAGVDDPSARTLFQWVRDAARTVPELLPGAIATRAAKTDDIDFQVVRRPPVVDLARQWAPPRAALSATL
jgi:RNA polymerase sigma factor (sigma-70 family)